MVECKRCCSLDLYESIGISAIISSPGTYPGDCARLTFAGMFNISSHRLSARDCRDLAANLIWAAERFEAIEGCTEST